MKHGFLCLALFCIGFVHAQTKVVVVNSFGKDDYIIKLLSLALSESQQQSYRVTHFENKLPKMRLFQMIEKNELLDVVASSANPEKLEYAKPIMFPIFKGAIGWRASLVIKDNKNIMHGVSSYEQFANLRAGQKLQWSDTKVLRHNAVTLVTSSNREGLYTMLEKQRFDHFPRSIIEIHNDIEQYMDKGFSIASNFLIHYPAAYVFYINKDEHQLFEDITTGLNKITDDGRFDELFNQNFGHIIKSFNSQDNVIVQLENPYLLEGFPAFDSNKWLSFPAKKVIHSPIN